MSRSRIAFIGLGVMGRPMARNLLAKGFSVAGFDVLPERMDALRADGLEASSSPSQAAKGAAFVITMVPADAEVVHAVLGPGGVAETAPTGCIWLQTSTIKPGTVQRIASALAPRGVKALDCPVSRGGRVEQGELCVYAGGDERDLAAARPVLEAVASEIIHCGPLGMGQAAKLINNMLSMVNVAMAAEALVLGTKAGLNPKVLYDVVNAGNGASVAWRDRTPQMWQREFEPELPVYADVAFKDLSLAIETAQEVGAPTLMSGLARELYNALRSHGCGRRHYAAVVTVLERMANHTVHDGP